MEQGSKTQNNVQAKIQDKEVHLQQCQGQNLGHGSTHEMMLRHRSKIRNHTGDNVKAKIQDKEFLKKCQSNIL